MLTDELKDSGGIFFVPVQYLCDQIYICASSSYLDR